MNESQSQALEVVGMAEMAVTRPAETVLKEAELVAGPWSRKVEELGLYKVIGPSKHLYIEAWQMMAAMYRVTARVRETRYVEFGEVRGYEAVAEAYHMPTGQVISTADAMCLNDEDNWSIRPKYEWKDGPGGRRTKTHVADVPVPLQQLRSMAQTRACSKVLSNLFKWVVKLRGYASTPAEEMTGAERTEAEAPRYREPQPAQAAQAAPNGAISDKQAARLWAIARTAGRSAAEVSAILAQHGYQAPEQIARSKYEEICAAVGGAQ
jgi:hypothetical protein